LRVFVTGAAGFLGRGVVDALLRAGHEVIGLVRKETTSEIGALRYVAGSVTDSSTDSLAGLMEGCDAVVHLVGIISEDHGRGQSFERIHVTGTANILDATKRIAPQIARFVYISAVGAAPDALAEYSRTKAAAENLVQHSGLPWTIFRPSLIFGPGAQFLDQIEQLLTKPPLSPFALPFVPVPGDGQNRFQPVYIGDMTRVIVASLTAPVTANRLYEIGGADEVTFDELIAAVGERIGVHKSILHVPLPLMFAGAAVLESLLPRPPITTDQLLNLKSDNTCDNNPVKEAFGLRPLALPQILYHCYIL
jgi:NADH dehydrogenase